MASSSFFHKPELALRRALELEGINQDEAALGILHEVLSSRRHRTWSPAYEQIMTTYLDLCLKLHRAREAKDGLHQYRNLAQQQAPGSLEKVIRHLMEKAEAKCSAAKAFVDAEQLALEDDEEGFGASPQAILLSTMSTDPAKSQRDSAVLLPSLKFLWETYRAVLDILRSNSKLEHVYHTAAQNALNFCRTYKRRMEFRHLCDMLRMHLGNLRQYGSIMETADDSKSNSKVRGWEGWSTESIELHLQTRFAQLETASVLHRYTEGFRTVEDIYNVLQISHARRKLQPDVPPPKAKLMAAYYEKLTTLFWVSENHLFHAFAWYKYYTLCKEYNRGMSEEMGQRQASAVLLAALCIKKTKTDTSSLDENVVQQKRARMATLLGFHTRNPTREGLLAEIQSKNILDHVPPYLRDLYNLLENASDPLIMVKKVRPLLAKLREEVGATTTTDTANEDVIDDTLGRYVKPLTTVLLLKLLVSLSAAYHTVSMDHLKQLTSGLGLTFEEVEKLLVQFTQTKALNVRMDHRAGCLRFGTADLEGMRSQLSVLAKQLQSVQDALVPPTPSASNRAAIYAEVRANLKAEHDAALERKNLIEKRKEEAERIAQEKIVEEQQQKEKEEAARKKEEETRIAREQRLRELDKQRKIQQELENKEKMRFFVAMGKNVDDMTEEQIAKIDTEALQKQHQDEITKKKEEAERKARETAKKLDYLIRAIRIEELPLIKKRYEEKIKADRERHEQETREKIEKAKEQWEADVKDKAILQEHGVFDHFEDFERLVMKGREIHHRALCEKADREAEIEAERAKIRRARKRKDDEIKQKAEEEARLRAEEERKKQEEERQKKEELRREREAKEEEARRKEEARMEEERRKKESQSRGPPGRSSYVPPSKRGAAGGGGDSRPSRFGDAGGYPGGGRYEGRGGGDRRGGYEDRRGGGGDRRGGGSGYEDRRGGGGYEDRRGGGGGGYEDRRGGGGYGDRQRGGGGYGGSDDRRGGGGYGRRDDDRGAGGGGRGDSGRTADSGRWR